MSQYGVESMRMKLLKNQNGFSLIEAMIAMVVLTVGLLAVGLLQIGAIKGNTNAISRSDGVAIAQTVLDELRSRPIDDTLLNTGANLNAGQPAGNTLPTAANIAAADHSGDEIFPTNQFTSQNGQTYTVLWNVLDNIPVTGAKTVRVFVYWNDQHFGVNRAIMTSVVGGLYL